MAGWLGLCGWLAGWLARHLLDRSAPASHRCPLNVYNLPCAYRAAKGATALMAAAVHGRADVVSALLSNGVRGAGGGGGVLVCAGPGAGAPPCSAGACGCRTPQPGTSRCRPSNPPPLPSLPQADPSVALPGAGAQTARDLAALYGHGAVVEVLDEFGEGAAAAEELANAALALSHYQAQTNADEVDVDLIHLLLMYACQVGVGVGVWVGGVGRCWMVCGVGSSLMACGMGALVFVRCSLVV